MKHTVIELRQFLANTKRFEQVDDLDTLDQWENYKDYRWLDDLFDVCKGIIEEIDGLNEYYNSL